MFCGGGLEPRIDRKDRLKDITKKIKNKQKQRKVEEGKSDIPTACILNRVSI
jgi:hypothetical protein